MCTCCDDITSFLEGLTVKMVLVTQDVNRIHLCVAQVYICNGGLEFAI